MTKYQEYVRRMLEANKGEFAAFRRLHDAYAIAADQDALQDEFNREGEKIMLVIREWEQKLCSQSEKAGFGSYTSSLSEKFQAEVKKEFPLIDHVGLIVKKFSLKKISLQ